MSLNRKLSRATYFEVNRFQSIFADKYDEMTESIPCIEKPSLFELRALTNLPEQRNPRKFNQIRDSDEELTPEQVINN